MENGYWHPDRSRRIAKRIVVTGLLTLSTPASFSTGEQDDVVDIPLLRDAVEPTRPLLTGASLAGALRAYLAAQEPEDAASRHTERLFGGRQRDSEGEQSQLIIADSLGENAQVELRHGVRIDPQSRTAADGALYDRILWAAGTRFPLRFELIVTCEKPSELPARETALRGALAAALLGLEREEIGFGGRKTRGCGQAKAGQWSVATYDMSRLADLRAWVDGRAPQDVRAGDRIAALLGEPLPGTSHEFVLRARFLLDGSLLVRTAGGANEPDMVQQRARQADGTTAAILAGTGLAGALRARSLRIANTLGLDAQALIEEIYGTDMARRDEDRKQGKTVAEVHASRLRVSEQAVVGGEADMVQARVSIDRFTGGALETALFSEQPVFSSGGEAAIEITLRLKRPEEAHIGLLLLALKDLWTHDLPVGGESSVGRGRWLGEWAELEYRVPGPAGGEPQRWTLRRAGAGRTAKLILPENAAELERFVRALHVWRAQSSKENITR